MKRILLAIALLAASLQAAPAPRDVLLGQQYFEFNAKYFGNRLPKNVLVFYAPISQQGEMGDTRDCGDTICIRLDPDYNKAPRVAAMTLLHEQCHIDTTGKDLDQHGAHFQACMYRLAALGAFNDLW